MFFFLILLKQILWIAVIPVFHTPDEQAHFAQVQNLAENTIPGKLSTSEEIVTAEKYLDVYRDASGNNRFTYHPEYRIVYTDSTIGKYENKIRNIPQASRKKLIFNEATWYPPLYYQFAAFGYKIVYPTDLISRVFFIRLWQTSLYLLMLYFFYLAAKLITNDKFIALIFLVFIGFLPMPSFVAAGVTSDNLMNTLFMAVIYLSLLCLKHGLAKKYFIFAAMIFILGVMTKPHFVIAIPIYAAAGFLRLFYEKQGKKIAALFSLLILAVFTIGSYMTNTKKAFFLDVGSALFVKERVSMPVTNYFFITLNKTYHETTPWFWGIYRWLSLAMPLWFYRLWNFLSAVSLLSLTLFLMQMRKKKKNLQFYQLTFLAAAVIIYYLVLFGWDYLFFLSHNFSFGLQGRYFFSVLFPIIFLLFYFLHFCALRVALAVYSVVINFFTLIYLAKSYYDFSSTSILLNQLSQYKPWYFKSMNFAAIFAAYLMCLVIFLIQLIKYAKTKH